MVKRAETLRLTVDELAQRTGFTVRNLRAMQTRGLLAPPALEGRTGYYGESHLKRVAMIKRLQARGYSLAAIGDLVEGWDARGGKGGIAALESAVMTPSIDDTRSLGHDEIAALVPELVGDVGLREKAIAAGLFMERDGALWTPKAVLIEAAKLVHELGLPWETMFVDLRWLRSQAEVVAEVFRQMFAKNFFNEFVRDGMPTDRLEELAKLITTLRPLMMRVFVGLLSVEVERGGPMVHPASSARAEDDDGPNADDLAKPASKPKKRARRPRGSRRA
ncbi:MAG: MerR family transcriptional regulator [Myxococcales bacterium]|nr:MerR family transcriptional regulator [Myxococcales bacterium]